MDHEAVKATRPGGVINTATPGLKDDKVVFFTLGVLIGAHSWDRGE